MCRSIKTLYNFEPPATADEVRAASLQFVRKVSGMRKPSAVNSQAFDDAVADIHARTMQLLSELQTSQPPKDRDAEAAKARAKWQAREQRQRERLAGG